MNDSWADYAEAFSYQIKSDEIFSRFVTNQAITGIYAEEFVWGLVNRVLGIMIVLPQQKFTSTYLQRKSSESLTKKGKFF